MPRYEKGQSGNPSTQFKPGQVANPNGRPRNIPDLNDLILESLSEEKDGKSALEIIILRLRSLAMKGDIRAINLLLDRVYGKPKETIDLLSLNKSSITVEFIKPERQIPTDES